ncbi:MAG: transglutaminase domain-containing protein [SAR202 cluster bacterium]|nr:transglutaminase domain-containing protein [SAR202 cluster bacterium]
MARQNRAAKSGVKKTPPISLVSTILQTLLSLVLIGLPMYVAFYPLQEAKWVAGLPPLIIPIAISLTFSLLLAYRGVSWRFAHPAATLLSGGLALGLGLPALSGGVDMGMGMFLIFVAAWLSHVAVWLSLRGPAPVLMGMPGLLVVLITLTFLPSDYFKYVPLYLLSLAPALAHFHVRRWVTQTGVLARGAPLLAALALVGVAVGFTWSAPSPEDPIRPNATKKFEDQFYGFWENTASVFDKLPNRRQWPQFNLHPDLPFNSVTDQSDDIMMLVKSDDAYKWRYRVYETYTGEGWTREEVAATDATTGVDLKDELQGLSDRKEVEIRVRLLSTNTHMATVGVPVGAEGTVLAEASPDRSFVFNLSGSQSTFLPPDLRTFRNDLANRRGSGRTSAAIERAVSAVGLEITSGLSSSSNPTSVTVQRAQEEVVPSLALLFSRRQAPPRSYLTRGSISVATPGDLRQASRSYPEWVTDRYLQLPTAYPQTVRSLATTLAAGQTNPYDIALSIQEFLHNIPYSLNVEAPPKGRDAVEWFLTEKHVGFCMYYASAMTTMLRSLGIPARLVVGFAPGDLDPDRDAYVVRAKHYHAWPEVYFPEYGWVEFEPTPPGVQSGLQELGLGDFGVATTPPPQVLEDECFLAGIDCGFVDDPSLNNGSDIELDNIVPNNPVVTDTEGGGGSLPTRPFMLAIFSLGALAAIIFAINMYMRHLRLRNGAPALNYMLLGLLGRLAGVPRRLQHTPSEYGLIMARALPAYAGSIERVVKSYELVLFSRAKTLDSEQALSLQRSWRTLRWGLLGLILRRRILRWFPPWRQAARPAPSPA